MAGTGASVKEIGLLRHGKSVWPADDRPDEERPLAKRGKRDARRLGAQILRLGLLPDLVLTSPARRARATAKRVMKEWPADVPLRVEDSLYGGGPLACLEALRRIPEPATSVVLVGHNPTWEELVAMLTGRRERLGTATLALVRVPVATWARLPAASRGTLRLILKAGEAPRYVDGPPAEDPDASGDAPEGDATESP